MLEIWKDIQGYEGIYQVSNLGVVRSLPRKGSPRLNYLKGGLDTSGYPIVGLVRQVGSRPKTTKVHTLVANAFLVKGEKCTDVNHINGVKADNRVQNLEWVTHSDNLKHAFRTGLKSQHGDLHHSKILTSNLVKEIFAKYKPRKVTRKHLAEEYGVSEATVKSIISKRNWRSIW